MFILAFTWHIVSNQHSIALLIIFFGISAVSTTTNVVYLPHLASFRPQLITPFFTGMGLGALFPSVVSLAQGMHACERKCHHFTVLIVLGVGRTECVNVTDNTGTVNATDNDGTVKIIVKEINLDPNFSIDVFYGEC